jgi:hypothetical protein
VPGTKIGTPPGLDLRNIDVNGPSQITAEYAIRPDSWLGGLNVTVTTPGGTSDPARFTIYPAVFQFGVPAGGASAKPAASATGQPAFESFDVAIHAAQVANPDGSQTDVYLDVSFSDDKGHPVQVGGSYHSDLDDVVAPDDPEPGPNVTPYSFGLQRPDAGKYVLYIKSSRSGSFDLEVDTTTSTAGDESQNGLAELDNVPTYRGKSFELKFVCRRDPFTVDLDSGGLQPPNGAFSFLQPLTSEVRLPGEENALAVVIYYDPVMEASSFSAMLDGSDLSSLFHVRGGELELVPVPLGLGRHDLRIRANNKTGLSSEQEFHIQH